MFSKSQKYLSPLRYPGGKSSLSGFLKELMVCNDIKLYYCEPYAGGAGAALELLFNNNVDRIYLNDADYHIYAFWHSILNSSDSFISEIHKTRISIAGWKRNKLIYDNPTEYDIFEVGFSTFYLNRCNRGGILPNAGPIGGFKQLGNYDIRARFNKHDLARRIERIAEYKQRINIANLDAVDFIRDVVSLLDLKNTLIYLDPPYYKNGKKLYHNYYDDADHSSIECFLRKHPHYNWVMTYDNVHEINSLYYKFRRFSFDLHYSVQSSKTGKELIIFSEMLRLPVEFKIRDFKKTISLVNHGISN